MHAMGLDRAPSVASLAQVFREAGVARAKPKKKPRSAWRRFVYPAPNACWQLDATEYVLTGGRKCVIFQLIDDHSRYAVASLVAQGETAEAAIAVFDKAVAAHGVPQRLLSDNGIALNPSRRGFLGQLVGHVSSLGVEAITGKPYKPTTQGKSGRFHQTLSRYLDKQPLADTLTGLQTQVDAFDDIYNTERPHQGLPGRITPQAAWQATPKAEAPHPKPDPPFFVHPVAKRHRPAPAPKDLPAAPESTRSRPRRPPRRVPCCPASPSGGHQQTGSTSQAARSAARSRRTPSSISDCSLQNAQRTLCLPSSWSS
jgi:putative transposase